MSSILCRGRNCYAVGKAVQSALLVDGETYFETFFRAAELAERSILMCGWQFDTMVRLLRGEAAERGLSAYVAEALRFKRDRDRLRELSDWLQEEHGPLSEEERTAAFEELEDLDAEHERRSAVGNHDAGEAA